MNIKRFRHLLFALTLVLLVSSAVGAADLVILHTNDVHGRLESFTPWGAENPVGGLVNLASVVKEVRAENPDATLLLDAGDAIHGTNVVNVFAGEPAVEIMNALGYDAMTIGNHEFNFGWKVLKERIEQAEFPVLCTNVIEKATGEPLGLSAKIVEVNGITVGLFGLATPDTPIVTHPKNVVGLMFLDPIERAKSIVDYLEDRTDLVIALTHLGYSQDRRLATEVPGIDVIVGGHSHTVLKEAMQVGDTIIVQAGEHARNLGVLELSVEDGKVTSFVAELIPITHETPVDPDTGAILATWNEKLQQQMEKVVGESAVNLQGERAKVRTQETNLGNLIADIMRETVGADIALTNGGGIRASINKGPITVGEIYTVLPFDNTLMKLEMTGAQIKAALENGVSNYPEHDGRFPQVSGLQFTFDPDREAGSRVVEVLVGGKPLQDDAVYTVATNDFMAAGGDGYEMMKDAKVLLETGEMLRDAIAKSIAGQGTVSPEVEGRITIK